MAASDLLGQHHPHQPDPRLPAGVRGEGRELLHGQRERVTFPDGTPVEVQREPPVEHYSPSLVTALPRSGSVSRAYTCTIAGLECPVWRITSA